jgi:hypothetical protein
MRVQLVNQRTSFLRDARTGELLPKLAKTIPFREIERVAASFPSDSIISQVTLPVRAERLYRLPGWAIKISRKFGAFGGKTDQSLCRGGCLVEIGICIDRADWSGKKHMVTPCIVRTYHLHPESYMRKQKNNIFPP